jgi:hypothetical protein
VTQIPEEDYTPELAKKLREKYWGKPDPNETLLIEGVDEIAFEEGPEEEKEEE